MNFTKISAATYGHIWLIWLGLVKAKPYSYRHLFIENVPKIHLVRYSGVPLS